MMQMQRIPVLLAALVLGGCAIAMNGDRHPQAAAACPDQSLVVLDFPMAPRLVEERDPCTRELLQCTKPVETEQDIRGWWFGSQDVYFNENMGRIAADIFADAIRSCNVFGVYARSDLRRYYADKAEVLNRELRLSRDQQQAALLQLDPISVGRELGVHKVLTGQVCDSEMRHSRAFGPFASAVSFRVALYDVASGQVEYSREYRVTRPFSSQYSLFEDFAGQFVADLRARYRR
jgi:hypothetical protein